MTEQDDRRRSAYFILGAILILGVLGVIKSPLFFNNPAFSEKERHKK